MAVKKVTEVVDNSVVEEVPTVEVEQEVKYETPVVVEVKEDFVEKTPEVTVDETAKVNHNNKPSGNVKIRMRCDHKCTIAMERYDLKEGKTYTVPENVKRILNKAGLLSPL